MDAKHQSMLVNLVVAIDDRRPINQEFLGSIYIYSDCTVWLDPVNVGESPTVKEG